MFLERQTELGEKCAALLIGAGRSDESDLETVDTGVLVDVYFGENDLLLETKGVVALSVHLLGYTVEVTDAGEGDADEPLKVLLLC